MSSSREQSERVTQGRASGRGTIRGRLARILALPAIVVLLLLALLAAGQIQDFRSSQATSRSVDIALSLQDLVHELQTERGITAAVQGGNISFTDELDPARKRVDQQLQVVRRQAGAEGAGAVNGRVRAVLSQLDTLTTVRAATDKAVKSATTAGVTISSLERQKTFTFFTDRIAALSQVDVDLDTAGDQQLRRGVATLQALQDVTEATAQERAFLNGVFSAGGFGSGEFVRFASMRADKTAAVQRFDRLATADQRASLAFVLSTGAAQTTNAFEQVALDAADGHRIVVNPQSWWSGLTTVLDDLGQLQEHVGSVTQVRAHDVQQQAALRLGGLVGLVLLCFIGSAYLASLASRSITRPLAELASEADKVAAERLPAAVRRIQSGDETPTQPEPVATSAQATSEIRQVATALERLQTAAYGLAVEQTMQRRDTVESLANLGRRNQNLIRRQLGFITTLEREEVDPTALANLFELDHLATRMRRNAASLLVLVGESSPRQWSSALPVADVIRAAVSEVEDYRRVLLRRVDDVPVHGSAIGSVAHLLSELIENGLLFSPPDTDVEVQGRRLPAGYLIAITDQGMGMSPAEMRDANARLQGHDDFVSAPTRYLGHHVVGKLAAETGVRVELIPSPVTGVTARVLLPESLLQPLREVGRAESRSAALPSGQPGQGGQAGAPAQSSPDEPVPPHLVTGPEAVPVTQPAESPAESEPLVAPVPVGARSVPSLSPPRGPRDLPVMPVTPEVVMPEPEPRTDRMPEPHRWPEPEPSTAGYQIGVDLTPAAGMPQPPPAVPIGLRENGYRENGHGSNGHHDNGVRGNGVSGEGVSGDGLRGDGLRDAGLADAGVGDPGVTRNGLRKREPRQQRQGGQSSTARVIDLDRGTEYTVPESVPGTPVTAGFSALRDGLARRSGPAVTEGPMNGSNSPSPSDSEQNQEDGA